VLGSISRIAFLATREARRTVFKRNEYVFQDGI
jgi:hypothetical protein